ncbi:RNA-binding protein [Kroppenstedtia eburnea]|uniref:RNA-binding protein n=1 Tax=Kroppenstedtia eburnea TaxID=714067 RepID=UPI003629649D
MDAMDAETRPQKGQVVQVLRGREAGGYAVVIGVVEPHFVLLADGDKRKVGQAKKKNIKHIQLTHYIAREVAESLEKDGRADDAKIRYALNQYLLRQERRKGE